MSVSETEGLLIAIAKLVFDRSWKPNTSNGALDNNLLPSMSNSGGNR